MSDIYNLAITAGGNNSAPPHGAPENMEYEEVNDTIRELMANLARWRVAGFSGILTEGTEPDYTLTSGQTFASYADGMHFMFAAHATSTGPVTLNVDAEGATAVVDARGVQLDDGDVVAGGVYFVVKTTSNFRVVGVLSSASIASMVGLTGFTTGGSLNAYTVTTGGLLGGAYENGQALLIVADRANTGAATINIDGLGAEALEDIDSAALAANDIVANQGLLIMRIGGEWRIIAGLPVNLATHAIGTLAIANGGTGQITAAAAFGALKQAATDTATGVIEHATAAEVRAATAGNLAVTPALLESAAAIVTLTDAATVALDWDAFIVGEVTVTASRVIGNPTNGQPGTFRHVVVKGNSATDRTITFGNQYLGDVPSLTDVDDTKNYLLSIFCYTATHFSVSAKRILG